MEKPCDESKESDKVSMVLVGIMVLLFFFTMYQVYDTQKEFNDMGENSENSNKITRG